MSTYGMLKPLTDMWTMVEELSLAVTELYLGTDVLKSLTNILSIFEAAKTATVRLGAETLPADNFLAEWEHMKLYLQGIKCDLARQLLSSVKRKGKLATEQ